MKPSRTKPEDWPVVSGPRLGDLRAKARALDDVLAAADILTGLIDEHPATPFFPASIHAAVAHLKTEVKDARSI